MKEAAVWQPLCVAVHINNWSGGPSLVIEI